MIKWLRKIFQKGDKNKPTTEEYVSLEYSEDFVDKLNSVVLNAKLFYGSGIYVCGNLTLEVKLIGKGNLLFDCILFDKNYDVVYHLLKESLWVTACRFPVADYQLYLAKSYLNRDWEYDDNRKQARKLTNKQHFSYKGYTGSIDFSTEDMCLFGKVQMIQDLIMYDGKTLEELKLSFESAVDEYLEMCA